MLNDGEGLSLDEAEATAVAEEEELGLSVAIPAGVAPSPHADSNTASPEMLKVLIRARRDKTGIRVFIGEHILKKLWLGE